MQNRRTLILMLLIFYQLCGYAQVNITSEQDKKIDLYINHIMQSQKIPGLALAITKDGKVLKKKTYGLASIEYQVPVSDSSVFWMASVSKHITCSAIMILSEDGLIDIDDTINKYLPDAPENWKGITIRHLMTHTSGLPESGKGSERGERSVRNSYRATQMYENAKRDTLNFEPGTQFLYSDEGIFLLGYIIHKISGMHFKEFMQKRIFDVAGMEDAYLMDQFVIHPNQVTGYSKKNGKVIPDRNSWRLIDTEINAAGGVYATIDDLIDWEHTMVTDNLLDEEIKDQMWTSHILPNGLKTFYGYGWNTQTINGQKVIYHPGVSGTEYLRFTEDNLSIIVLTNQADYERSIAQRVAEILGITSEVDEDDIKTAEVITSILTKKEIKSLTGLYKFVPNGNYYLEENFLVAIKADQSDLFVEFPANKEWYQKFKLGKLKNGRLIQLSWFPNFLEITYELKHENGTPVIHIYEDYGLGVDVKIGILTPIIE